MIGQSERRECRRDMARLVLRAEVRHEHGKGAARRLRAAGRVPAVVYGAGDGPVALSLDAQEFDHVLRGLVGEHAIVDLKVAKKRSKQTVLIQTVQHHALGDEPIHVDFLRVRMDERITTTVPLALVGTCKGVKDQGGVLDHTLHEIEVECLPDNLPETIEVDVTDLMMHDSLHVSDMALPEGVAAITPGDRVVAHVLAPRVVEVEAPVAEEVEEAAEAEPERIGEEAEAKEAGGEETE